MNIIYQIVTLLIFLGLGIFSGVLFSIFGILREKITLIQTKVRKNKSVKCFFLEFLIQSICFFLVLFLFFLFYLHAYLLNDGVINIFFVLFYFFSIFLYTKYLNKIVAKIFVSLYNIWVKVVHFHDGKHKKKFNTAD